MEENEIYAVENQGQVPPQNNKQEKGNGGKYYACGLVTGLAAALLIISIAYLVNRVEAYYQARLSTTLPATEESSGEALNGTSGAEGGEAEGANEAADDNTLAKMKVIEEIIDTYFYKDDVDKEAMIDGIYKGMVESLGDPYSEYYTAEELTDMLTSSQGIYYGIGAYVSMDKVTGYPMVSGVMKNTPAEEAGLQENDVLYKADDQDLYGLSLTEAVALIKGEEGTQVHLNIIRNGEELEFDVTRKQVESPTVNTASYENGMEYIQITEFDTVTVDQFFTALKDAKNNNMKGLIIDLRSNPGGNLAAVVDIARMILPEGMIVYTEDRYGKRNDYTCDGKNELDVPLVVLINGNSASASEILSGAVKDYGIGTLMGTTTYGKGIVQQPITMSDGSAVKLTISSYFTPNGNNIHGIGIDPDIEVEFDSERYYSEEKYDNQLEAAKEQLLQMIQE